MADNVNRSCTAVHSTTEGAGAKPQIGGFAAVAATDATPTSTAPSSAHAAGPRRRAGSPFPLKPPAALGPNGPSCATPASSDAPSCAEAASPVALGLVQGTISGECSKSLDNSPAAERRMVAWGPGEAWERLRQVDGLLSDWRHARAELFEKRAREARRSKDRTRARWYEGRAEALASSWTSRAVACGTERVLELTCHGCGSVRTRPVMCGLRHWCSECARIRSRREFKRLAPALGARARQERVAWLKAGRPWRRAPQLRLLTLTIRHLGTLEETRERIAKAWPKWRRWLRKEIGYAPSYCASWEVTDSDGGHPHLHVCIVLPFLDIARASAAWVTATRGAAEGQGLDLRTVGTTTAARYVSAYVTASALDPATAPEVAAAWVRTTYGRRLVSTSRGFWLPDARGQRCDCGSCEPPSAAIRPADDKRLNPVSTGPPLPPTEPQEPLPPRAEREAALIHAACNLTAPYRGV